MKFLEKVLKCKNNEASFKKIEKHYSVTPNKNVELADQSTERVAGKSNVIGLSVYVDPIYKREFTIYLLNKFLIYYFEVLSTCLAMPSPVYLSLKYKK